MTAPRGLMSPSPGGHGAVELQEALGAFAMTVEVDGAEGNCQLAAELGNICGI